MRLRAIPTALDRPPVAGSDFAVPHDVRVPTKKTWSWRALAAWGGVGLVTAALLLVVLRMDQVSMRYRLADAMQTERELLEEQRALTLKVERLRNPTRLASEGARLGLKRPERVITLPPPPTVAAARSSR